MKYSMFIAAAALFAGHIAFGAQENRGLSYCSPAQAICQSADSSIVVCVFTNHTYVELNTSQNSNFYNFKSKVVPTHPGLLGAGVVYAGPKSTLVIKTDTAPSADGIYSTLTVPSLHLKNEPLRCLFSDNQ